MASIATMLSYNERGTLCCPEVGANLKPVDRNSAESEMASKRESFFMFMFFVSLPLSMPKGFQPISEDFYTLIVQSGTVGCAIIHQPINHIPGSFKKIY